MKNLSSRGLVWVQKLLIKRPRTLLLQSCLHPARVTASDTRSRPWLLTGVSRSTTHLCCSHLPPGRQLQAAQCAPNLEWCNNVRHMPHENRCTTGAAHTGHKTYSIQSCWFYDDIGYYHLDCLGEYCNVRSRTLTLVYVFISVVWCGYLVICRWSIDLKSNFFCAKRFNMEIWAGVHFILGLLRSGIGIFSMSQEFLEILAGVPLILDLSRSKSV